MSKSMQSRWRSKTQRTSRAKARRGRRQRTLPYETLEGRLMMVADLRDMLLADHATDSILRFDGETGAPLGEFVSSGSGGLVDPHNPTFGPDGNLYVFSTEPGAQKILEYNGETGAFVGTFVDTGSGGFAGGFAMQFGPNGDLYVATGGANVLRYDGDTGAFVGIAAAGNGIARASGVEFGPDGNLYVLDSDNSIDTAYDRILRFDADTAAFIDVFVRPGSLEDSIAFTFGPDGHLYVPDLKLEQTRIFNGTTGDYQGVLSVETGGATSPVFDIVFGSDGNTYAATAERILRFEGETGTFLDTFVEGTGGSIVFFPSPDGATDLVVTLDSVPAEAFIGEQISIAYTVQNDSANAVPDSDWVDVVYLSSDNVFDPGDFEIGRVDRTGGLTSASSYSELLGGTTPDALYGDYYVIVVTDRRGATNDADRSNNIAVSSTTVEVLPRLAEFDPAFTIAVGRTLSTYTTDSLVGNQLTITYAVYNLTPGVVTDISLSTTLLAGVQFASSSVPVTANGQSLSWDLESLGPLGFVTIDVVVTLDNSLPLAIDNGIAASGHVNFTEVVEDTLSPTTLRTDPIDTSLLAATPDANSADVFVRAKAAELNQDPNEIFEFVSDRIGFESYTGSLRGARGTLWSQAGNALDQSSLLIALLRASGIPAQYVEGTLADPAAKALILSMFNDPTLVTGFLEPGAQLSDPANDPQLLAEAKEHYWVQFDTGGGIESADPTVLDASLGQTFAAADGTFTEVADELRHKATIRIERELTTLAMGLLGLPGQNLATVLEATFNTVDLVGKPLSVGHFVNSRTLPSPVFTSTTNTYSPYVVVGDVLQSLDEADVVRGTDYEEVLTTFPLGSQILTGIFLEVELTGPDGPPEVFSRELLDRIGFSARQNGGNINLNLSGDGAPAVSDLDIFTVNVLPGRTDSLYSAKLFDEALKYLTARRTLATVTSPTADQAFAVRALVTELTRLQLANFLSASDDITSDLAETLLVKAYYDRPRLTISSHVVDSDDPSGAARGALQLDLRRDRIRAIAQPGQSLEAVTAFQQLYGYLENSTESDVVSMANAGAAGGVSAIDVVQAAVVAGIPLIDLRIGNLAQLEGLGISAEAKARISAAINDGKTVLVPSQMVEIDGEPAIAWFETDPLTGEVVGVNEDGTHGWIDWVVGFSLVALIAGFAFVGVANTSAAQGFALYSELKKCNSIKDPAERAKCIKAVMEKVKALPKDLLGEIAKSTFVVAVLIDPDVDIPTNNNLLFQSAFSVFAAAAVEPQFDPPLELPPYLVAVPQLGAFDDLTGPGLKIDVVQDPNFVFVQNGYNALTVFRVGILNDTGQDDVFSLNVVSPPPGFEVITSLSEVRIPAGTTAEIGLVLKPIGDLPAPGADAAFTVEVSSVTNGATTATDSESFTVPEVHGVTLEIAPAELTAIPGQPVQASLIVRSTGNVSESVHLTAALADVLNLAGLQDVTLTPGEQTTVPLTLTPAAGLALNTNLLVQFTADYGGGEPLVVSLPVAIAAPGAAAAGESAAAAGALGNRELADRLDDLRIALTNLAQNTSNPIYKEQVIDGLTAIIAICDLDSALRQMSGDLTQARTSLQSASDDSAIVAAIGGVADVLDDLTTLLNALVKGNVEFFMLPNVQTAQPLVPKQFLVKVHNIGTETTTYNLSVSGLPAEVTSQLSTQQITLARDEFADVMLTLTQTTTDELLAFDFSFDATIDGVTPVVTKSVIGTLQTRKEVVAITNVSLGPPFTDAGNDVLVSARVLNAVNQARNAVAVFEVKAPGGAVVYTSPEVEFGLDTANSLTTVDLGFFSTAGYANGEYTVTVTLYEDGQPIPGATRDGKLLVGTPLTANYSNFPDDLPPGDGTVNNRLDIVLGNSLPGGNFLELVGQVNLNDTLRGGIVQKDNLLYIGGEQGIHVVNVADAENPVQAGFRAGRTTSLAQSGDRLYAIDFGINTTNPVFSNGTLRTYSFTEGAIFPAPSPTNPVQIGSTTFGYQLVGAQLINGNTLYAAEVTFWWENFDVKYQTGDVFSFDLSNSNPALLDVLDNSYGTAQDAEGIRSGGPYHMFQLAQADATTLLAASTTQTTVNDVFVPGDGAVRIVDISNPANLTEAGLLTIPGTEFVTGVTVVGNRAYLVGTTGGWRDPFVVVEDSGPTGTLVFTTLDITDPRNPLILGQTSIDRSAHGVGALVSIGGTKLAFSTLGAPADGDPRLWVLDFADPDDVQIISDVDLNIDPASMTTDGDYLYVVGSAGLSVFSLGDGAPTPVHVEVQIPNGTGVDIVANSFNVEPTDIIAGVEYNTLVWDLALSGAVTSQELTWQTSVSALQPGESRAYSLGTTVDYTLAGTPGSVELPAQNIAAKQIISLGPDGQTVAPGETAVYTLFLENPTSSDAFYIFDVTGIPSEWVDMLPLTLVPANGFVGIDIAITAPPSTPLADYQFVVSAEINGLKTFVGGKLTLAGESVRGDYGVAKGILAELIPTTGTAGQGTSATYTVRVTNTGSHPDTFVVFDTDLPAGFTTTYDTPFFELLPGPENAREITLTVTAPVGTTPASYPFLITAASTTDVSIIGVADGAVNVINLGVGADIVEASGLPGSVFQFVVTNTGSTTDTFELFLSAPAAIEASLAQNTVTLAPGASQTIAIQVADIDYAFPGGLPLVATARSQTNEQILASDQANVAIVGVLDVSAEFNQNSIQLPLPGEGTFLLFVNNLGNLEDSYSVEILGTTGPVVATLRGLTGQPATAIPQIILPGFATGGIVLNSILTGAGTGTVTLRVRSLTNSDLFVDTVASLFTADVGTAESSTSVSLTNGSTYGDFFTFEAIVSADSATPTGFVQFQIDGSNVGSPVALVAGKASYTTASTLDVSTYTVTAVYLGDDGFAGSQGNAPFEVDPAQLTINADPIQKVYGAELPALSVSYSGFVGGDGPEDLLTLPSLSTTATKQSGVGFYDITVGGAASNNYVIEHNSAQLEVTPAELTIKAQDKTKVYGAPIPTLTYVVEGLVNNDTASVITTLPTLSTSATAGSSVGFYPITANGAVAANYKTVYVDGQLEVTRATITITAADKAKVYGADLPELTYSLEGLVNNDAPSVITTLPTLTTSATRQSNVGFYAITANGAAATNYQFEYVPGLLEITRAALQITAAGKTKVYGAALPALTASYSGFVNGDEPSDLTALPTLSTPATESSNVAFYPITASGAVSSNYSISYVDGQLEVTRAPLLIRADNKTMTQNGTFPTLTATYEGLVNGDTPADLDTPPALSTAATVSSPPGDYSIIASGAADQNYSIQFANGILHVDPPAPTVGVDVRLTSTGSPSSVVAGKGIVTYAFTVKNIGTMNASNLRISLASILPAGVTAKSIAPPSGTSFQGTATSGTWKIPSLKKGASVTLCITLNVGSSTTPGVNVIQTTATAASADQALINTSNDTTTQMTSVVVSADVAVTKHTAPSTVAAGQTITYQVTIKNNGPGAAQNVSLTDVLPGGTTFVSQVQNSGPSFVLSNTSTQVSNTIASLASKASASFTIVVQVGDNVSKNQKLVNRITVTTDSADPKGTNNTSSATTTVSKSGNRPPCQNPGSYPHAHLDVDADGLVAPGDVLLLIDRVNRLGSHLLPTVSQGLPYYDCNGDGWLTLADVGMVLDFLRRGGSGLLASFESSSLAETSNQPVESNSSSAVAFEPIALGFTTSTVRDVGWPASSVSSSAALTAGVSTAVVEVPVGQTQLHLPQPAFESWEFSDRRSLGARSAHDELFENIDEFEWRDELL